MTRHVCEKCGAKFRRGKDSYGTTFRLCTRCGISEQAPADAAAQDALVNQFIDLVQGSDIGEIFAPPRPARRR